MVNWTMIDIDYKSKLPKKDCQLWITRIAYPGGRWVQKINYYAKKHDIDYDGTIAWMIADEENTEPEPCRAKCVVIIENVH